MRRVFANANYDFISRRRKAYLLSGLAVGIALLSAVFWQFREGTWMNYGVDFTGGSIVQVQVAGAPPVGEVRSVVTSQVPGSQVTTFGDPNEFLIRTPGTGADEASRPADMVVTALQGQYGQENVVVERTEAVGAKVGGELQTRALLAILISFIATLIYLAVRFEWRFGLAAIVATAHDIILTLGLLAILRMEISLPTVAAFLTIVGYSLNDTIVIFDRVRENLASAKRQNFIEVLNRSINNTLPRTVLTSGTTLVTLIALYLFGGVIIRDFALILIVGVLLGTYSSIFVAAPALLEIEKRFPPEQQPVAKRTSHKRASPRMA
jgi:preprotein translocase subunit SecF